MRTITAIEGQKRGRKGRANIFLDGRFAFSLDPSVIQGADLAVGKELLEPQVEELLKDDLFHRAWDLALRYLGYRPRSQREVRQQLARHKFDPQNIERVIQRLQGQGLLNDLAFARFWKENRESFSPRSRRLLKLELRAKGVEGEGVEEVLEDLDEEASAFRAAQRKARILKGEDYAGFRKRLGAFLKRRGFSYEVIQLTVNRLWHEERERTS